MSTYLKCKICGLSSNSIFDEATEKTRCELFAHVFEEFTYLKPTYIKKPKPDRLKSKYRREMLKNILQLLQKISGSQKEVSIIKEYKV